MIYVVRKHAVLCALSAFIGFLIADKYIVRLFILRDSENTFLYLVYRLCLRLIDNFLTYIGILNSELVVLIGSDSIIGRSVTGGYTLIGRGVFNVFNAVFAQNYAPVSLRLRVVKSDNFIIYLLRLVKLGL